MQLTSDSSQGDPMLKIHWRLVSDMDPAWRWTNVLYAYCGTDSLRPFYVSHTSNSVVERRDLLSCWRQDAQLVGQRAHRTLVGRIVSPKGCILDDHGLQQVVAYLQKSIRDAQDPEPGLSCMGRAWIANAISKNSAALTQPFRDRESATPLLETCVPSLQRWCSIP
jgi:hypothetical protein